MQYLSGIIIICSAFTIAGPSAALAGANLTPESVTVGQRLETIANVTLSEAAPDAGVEITLTSGDPARVLLSDRPDGPGMPKIVLKVRAGLRGSPDYYIQGLGKGGSVAYTASARGFETGSGTVELAPSAIIFARSGIGVPLIQTTTGASKVEFGVLSALLDSSLNFVRAQPVAGDAPVRVDISNSDKRVGVILPSPVVIAGGSASATIAFQPLAAGDTQLSVTVPAGFTAPAEFGSIGAKVIVPGLMVTDGLAIGRDLQLTGIVGLGEPAPKGGLTVTLSSKDTAKLLLAASPDHPGSGSITVQIASGGVNATFYLQALSDSGTVAYTATAPGFRAREGSVTLTPSGLVMGGPQGPPDEGELLNKEAAEGPHGFVTSLAAGTPTVVSVYTVQLDPATRRGADLTVQPLRPGVSLKAALQNSNPSVGQFKTTELVIAPGSSTAVTHFVPLTVGSTVLSVVPPSGFTRATNSTSLAVSVRE